MRRGLSYLLSTEDRESGLVIPYRHGDLVPLVIEGRIIGKRSPGRYRAGMLVRVKDDSPYVAVKRTIRKDLPGHKTHIHIRAAWLYR